MIITESTWVHPEGYQSEGPFLMAAYQSLTGVAGYYWFSATAARIRPRPVPALPELERPASAVQMELLDAVLDGPIPGGGPDVSQGLYQARRGGGPRRTAAGRHVGTEGAADRRGPQLRSEPLHRRHRRRKIERQGRRRSAGVPGRPVEVKYGGDPAKTTTVDLAKYIDKEKKTVRSITGEIRLDYGTGLCTVDTAQGPGGERLS